MKSIGYFFCEIFLGVVIFIDDWFIKINEFPLANVEVFEFVFFLSYPNFVFPMVVQSLVHPT